MGIAENLAGIRQRIESACESVGRDPSEVVLIGVTKTVPIELILEAYEAGLRDFGENRYQDAAPKLAHVPSDVTWHFIGKLQSNKARKVAESFDVLHTLESENQMREIQKSGKVLECFVEVNVAREPQKAGIFPEGLDELLAKASHYSCIRIRGLMTVGPQNPESNANRSTFRTLADLAKTHRLPCSSMGMSADFEVAIQEGSTHVRVGTALFGYRG